MSVWYVQRTSLRADTNSAPGEFQLAGGCVASLSTTALWYLMNESWIWLTIEFSSLRLSPMIARPFGFLNRSRPAMSVGPDVIGSSRISSLMPSGS